ncbi:MAG: conjugal transfer protein TraX [Oscillibacter sp.]|nr:conjugal transfer protein TraX [Oscillibacter sp.]
METVEKRRKIFSGYALKYFAMFFMLCDHIGLLVIRRGIFAPYTVAADDGMLMNFSEAPAWIDAVQKLYTVLDVLGHAALPIFCFLLVEGVVHTRSKKRYLLTLLAFALISEPIYDQAHYGVWSSFRLQNVLFTLSIGCAMLWVLETVAKRALAAPKKRWGLTILTVLAAGGLAFLVRGEYVFLGTTAIALFFLLRNRGAWRLAGLVPLLIASPWVLLAAPVLYAYNGQRGKRGWKYFFYVFYPAHFLVLMGVGNLFAKL